MKTTLLLLYTLCWTPPGCQNMNFHFSQHGLDGTYEPPIPEHAQMNTSEELKMFFFGDCKPDSMMMKQLCAEKVLSCFGRCGDFLGNLEGLKFAKCSCDVLCPIYNDCCWDFQFECSAIHHEHEKTYAKLESVEMECEDGIAIITGCPITIGKVSEKWGPQDYREPILTHLKTGLQFRNSSVYKCFFEEDHLNNVLPWNKTIKAHSSISYDEMKQFIFNGTTTELLRTGLQDIMPSTISVRLCFHKQLTRITCPRLSSFDTCQNPKNHVYVDNATMVCDSWWTETELFFDPLQFQKTTKTFSTTGPTMPTTIIMSEGCFSSPFSRKPRSSSDTPFSVTMSFNDKGSLQITSLSSSYDPGWVGLNFTATNSNDHEEESPHELMILCATGYISNENSCQIPDTMRIQIIGMDSPDYISEILHKLIRALSSKFKDYLTLELGWFIEVKDSQLIIMETSITISNYNLEYNTIRLPISDYVIQFMETQTGDLTTFLELAACLSVSAKSHQAQHVSVCDRMSFNPLSCRKPLHFIMHEDIIPYPDWMRKIASLSVSGGGKKTSSQFHLLIISMVALKFNSFICCLLIPIPIHFLLKDDAFHLKESHVNELQ